MNNINQIALIDTHTHFDVAEFADSRAQFAQRAYQQGVRHLLIIGLLARHFDRMIAVRDELAALSDVPMAHLAFGLHPLYIDEQTADDLAMLDRYLQDFGGVAVSEIGLDSFPKHLQNTPLFDKQRAFFIEQIGLAKRFNLPIVMHIRRSHAEVLKILSEQKYSGEQFGGIAHSFSGGEQEALAFVKRGFKLGITGQITNPNAKKLHRSVQAVFAKYGAQAFVIETDSPDMLPLPCHGLSDLNEPANLPLVLDTLAQLFAMDKWDLAQILWQNSCEALRTDFAK